MYPLLHCKELDVIGILRLKLTMNHVLSVKTAKDP